MRNQVSPIAVDMSLDHIAKIYRDGRLVVTETGFSNFVDEFLRGLTRTNCLVYRNAVPGAKLPLHWDDVRISISSSVTPLGKRRENHYDTIEVNYLLSDGSKSAHYFPQRAVRRKCRTARRKCGGAE